jgi:hypothetical protein
LVTTIGLGPIIAPLILFRFNLEKCPHLFMRANFVNTSSNSAASTGYSGDLAGDGVTRCRFPTTIGVGVALAGEPLGDSAAVGLGVGLEAGVGDALTGLPVPAGVPAGEVSAAGVGPVAVPNEIAPDCHIVARLSLFISISIGIRFGFAGVCGSCIGLSLIDSLAAAASDFA